MSNNYIQFSVAIQCESVEELEWFERQTDMGAIEEAVEQGDADAIVLLDEWREEMLPAFETVIDKADKTATIFAMDYGHVSSVEKILRAYLKRFHPDRAIAFEWAATCDKPIPGDFGGGACIVRAKRSKWMNTATWIENNMNR